MTLITNLIAWFNHAGFIAFLRTLIGKMTLGATSIVFNFLMNWTFSNCTKDIIMVISLVFIPLY